MSGIKTGEIANPKKMSEPADAQATHSCVLEFHLELSS
jgi:hypothetical protein